jgi:hypothetical protein
VHPGGRLRRTDDGIEIWPVATQPLALAQRTLWP